MILKEDYRSIVEQDNGVIIKTFKDGSQLSPESFNEEWKQHINNFGRLYGHFPKILELSKTRIVMEQVHGAPFTKTRTESYKHSIDRQIKDFKLLQFAYYKFIHNLLKYNIDYKCNLVHKDLNYNNMFLSDGRWHHGANLLVCIDLDSAKMFEFTVPNSFIAFPHSIMQADAESLEYQMNRQEQRKLKKKYEN
jgi:thiamine kinase-like enzyme